MPAVKSSQDSADKWASRSAAAGGDYKKGVQQPKRSWAQATSDSQDAWKEGVTAAASSGRFASGVNAAGDGKWQRKAATVGASRYSSGVQAGKGDYQAGFAPYKSVIEGVTLPPRGPKGSPSNYQRVQAVGEALHNAKVGGASS
jgi:hypothetical protein